MRAAVELQGVRRTYGRGDSAVHALRGIDMALPPGTFTALMGPSGSGKSTFLQCAAGLDRPTAGSVFLGEVEITRMSEKRLTELRRSRVGFVFQSFNLLPSLTVLQNVVLPQRLDGRRPDRRRAMELLGQVGLDGQARRRPGQLSGGQQQRVAIARALITEPEVIFADEPTGALDSGTAHEVLRLLAGTTRRQVLSMMRWEALLVTAAGLLIGAGILAVTLSPFARGATGGPPYVPPLTVLVMAGGIVLGGLAATGLPARVLLRTPPATAAAARE